eukprot:8926867-Pyramimonas_sp.AAC.1
MPVPSKPSANNWRGELNSSVAERLNKGLMAAWSPTSWKSSCARSSMAEPSLTSAQSPNAKMELSAPPRTRS